MSDDAGAALAACAEQLAAPGSGVSVSARHDGPRDYLYVPNRRSPRLLVPASPSAAAARSMMRFSASLSAREAVGRLGLAAALRVGAGRFLPDGLTVAPRHAGGLADHLAAALGVESVVFSLGVGTARANRKPVLQVFDTDGRSLAFVKLGVTEVSRTDVTAEAESLRLLEASPLPTTLEVPRLLHLGEWEGMTVLAMTALRTSFAQRPRAQWHVPHALMDSFGRAFGSGSVRRLVEMPLWARIAADVAQLPPTAVQASLSRSLERLAPYADGADFVEATWHGDWTPWNMARAHRRTQLWDFERLESGVPLGLDALHYGVNTYTRAHGLSVPHVRAGLVMGRPACEDRGSADAVLAATYLATITVRYQKSVHRIGGHLVSDRAELMANALDDWLDSMEESR